MDRWDIPEAVRVRMIEVARRFRKEPTASEALLWRALRGKQLHGRKFRRQQPIGPFVVDFYCASERLIIEIDGPIHATQRDADLQRQHLLESLGLRFVRIAARDVETDIPAVLAAIQDNLEAVTPQGCRVSYERAPAVAHRCRFVGTGATVFRVTSRIIQAEQRSPASRGAGLDLNHA